MKTIHPQEFKVMSLRECPVPNDLLVCETPEQANAYWRLHPSGACSRGLSCGNSDKRLGRDSATQSSER